MDKNSGFSSDSKAVSSPSLSQSEGYIEAGLSRFRACLVRLHEEALQALVVRHGVLVVDEVALTQSASPVVEPD